MENLPIIAQIVAFLYVTFVATTITPADNVQSRVFFTFLPYLISLLLATTLIQQFVL